MNHDLIARTRPTETGLAAEWTAEDRADVLAGVLAAPLARHHGRRWLLGSAAAGAAAVVGAAVILPGWFATPAAAAQLEPVALAALGRSAPAWRDGQYLHVRTTETQSDEQDPRHQQVIDDWRAPDGWTWSKRDITSSTMPDRKEFYVFPPGWGWMRPGYAATMPTEPHLLDAFLRARVSGSTSADEAVFVAVGDMLRQEAAAADLRAAAIRVLGLNPKVTVTEAKDPSGRPAVRATFVDEAARPGMRQELYLDPSSGVLLAKAEAWPGGNFRGVISVREVVDTLPADIAAKLGTEKVALEYVDGKRVPMDSEPGPDPVTYPSDDYTPYPKPSTTR